ncbi:MAG: septal ring lytic transglycosylase RlpA family protein [Bradyrhizobiaceae bacterium]|nr:septal ring lytic transglycosylase RlpA family protein [Bradyrhizobiaceae bacterium]
MRPTILSAIAAAIFAAGTQLAAAETVTRGKASFYSHGSKTASGERYDPNGMTAAHRTLPFGTRVRVTDTRTRRSAVVRINDRGPFIKGRIIDVSRGAARQLGMIGRGVAMVDIQVVR